MEEKQDLSSLEYTMSKDIKIIITTMASALIKRCGFLCVLQLIVIIYFTPLILKDIVHG